MYDTSLRERFNAKWVRDAQTGCHMWTAALYGYNRYGCFSIKRRLRGAHRVAWELEKGPVPAGLFVLHRCDTPACVNVEHLFLGTIKDNVDDMMAKGRKFIMHGEMHAAAKLTDAECAEIRERYAAGDVSQSQLAREYGCRQQCISKLVNYQRRRDLLPAF